MDALASSLKASPELFPHSLDLDRAAVGLVRLSRAELDAASFLDDRILGPERSLEWVGAAALAAAVEAAELGERCGFIFHLGHVGSTLVSRLVGAHPQALGLREPQALRTLAQADAPEPYTTTLLKLWSRTFERGETAVIKATSFCCGLAEALLGRPSRPRAVFLSTPPEPFLATILGGAANEIDIRAMAAGRLDRLHRRIGRPAWQLQQLSLPELAAMSWATEMTALDDAAASAQPSQARFIDFERFLARPQRQLAEVFTGLGLEASDQEIAAILQGPDMGRYSKAPEHAYGAQLRAQLLNQARAVRAAEIRRGLDWLEGAAAEHPAIAAAVERAGGV